MRLLTATIRHIIPAEPQRPRGTGWVEPRPLEAPPGIEHVDRLVDAQDRIDRAELIAKLTKGKD